MSTTRIPPLRSLQTFCVAARHLSFKAAAAETFVSPSAISHQMRELERQLGMRLFERGVRELRLTPEGRRLFDEIDPLMRGIEAAARRASGAIERRTVRLLLMPFFANELVIPRLPAFVLTQSQLDLRIETRALQSAEHSPDVDVSVLLRRDPPAGVTTYPLLATHLVPACSPELRARLEGYSCVDLAADEDLTLIVQRARPDAWTAWFAAAGITPATTRRLIQLDTMDTVVAAAERGLGIALVPIPLVESRFNRGSLVRLCETPFDTQHRYYLVHRMEDERRPEVRDLRDWLLAEFAAHG